MKTKKLRDDDSRPVNRILVAVSFIIFGVFGMIFLTQMELQPGWAWEDILDTYPIEITPLKGEDINGDGISEIIAFADIQGTDRPERYTNIQYGGVFCLDGSNGNVLWLREYNTPVRKLFPVMDIDGDGKKDYFISKVPISPNWTEQNDHYVPDFYLNLCTNLIINGSDGEDLPIPSVGVFNYTNFYIHDLISLNDGFDAFDDREDLIVLEGEMYDFYNPWDDRWDLNYAFNISSYLINGTRTKTISAFNGTVFERSNFPKLELFEHSGQSHILYLDSRSIILLNTSASNFLSPIYNIPLTKDINEYLIIEDLNLDNIPEILTTRWDGNFSLRDGSTGALIREFTFPPTTSDVRLDYVHSPEGDGLAYFVLNVGYWYGENEPREKLIQIFSIDLTSQEVIWEHSIQGLEIEAEVYVLHEDMNGDLIDEIIFFERHMPLIGLSEVGRYRLINFITHEDLQILNTEYHSSSVITIDDFDGDGKKDYVLSGDDRVVALSSRKEMGLWLSPLFPMGLPLFIILSILLVLGIVIAAVWGKRLSYQRKNIKQHKLTVYVNAIAIILISLFFVLFLILMNIFNNTLISGSNNTEIIITFLIVIIVWYGALPLTAALYNRFAPQFAFIFVKLRSLFFKISRSYQHDILVLDMEDRKEIGLTIQVKRLILPLLLSIAVGFYAYNTLAPILGLPQTFEVFGSTEFFDFIRGYMLCCVLPMILSFLLFAFFISGNFLLDDAGVVYFRQNKKYRQPGDIEPISIWAQSIIKGIAGVSALITFTSFLTTIDFSGFFGEEGDLFMFFFGILVVVVMFGGIPFLTGFSYTLLAGEIMELTNEKNVSKLYKLMEKDGYDIKPRKIYNIYPEGNIPSQQEKVKVNDSE
ncbi:MAG: hypothetical protein ACFFBT_05755 [Promethearchaeota archaeon]